MAKSKKKHTRQRRCGGLVRVLQILLLVGVLLFGGGGGAKAAPINQTGTGAVSIDKDTTEGIPTYFEKDGSEPSFKTAQAASYDTLSIDGTGGGTTVKLTITTGHNVTFSDTVTVQGTTGNVGILNINTGATLNAGDTTTIDGGALIVYGTYNAIAAGTTISSGTLTVNSSGEYNMSGQSLTVSGTGGLTILGGTLIVQDVTMQDTASVTQDAALTIDGTGNAANKYKSLTISGGTYDMSGKDLTVSGDGTLTLSGTGVLMAKDVTFDSTGTSTVTGMWAENVSVSNGTVNQGADLEIDGTGGTAENIYKNLTISDSTYDMSGYDLTVSGTGELTIAIDGGVLKAQNVVIGGSGSSALGNGMWAQNVTIQGTAVVTQDADVTLNGVGGTAANTYASLTVSGGSYDMTGYDLTVKDTGFVDTSDGSGNAGGTLMARDVTIGGSGTSTVTGMWARDVTVKNTAIVTQDAALTIDGVGNSATTGAANTYRNLTVSGGVYDAGINNITVSNTGTLSLSGAGEIKAAVVQLTANDTVFNITGGTALVPNTITGGLTVTSGTVNLGTAQAPGYLKVTDDVNFASGTTLNTFAAHSVLQGVAGQSIDTVAGAKLHITGGATGTYALTSGFDTPAANQTGWLGNDLTVNDPFMSATGSWATTANNYTLTLAYNNVAPAFPEMQGSMVGLANAMLQQRGMDVNSTDPSQRFVSRALSNSYLGANQHRQAVATLEGAAQVAPVGAAQGVTLSAQNAGVGAMIARTSFANPLGDVKGGAVHMNDGRVSQTGISGGDSGSGLNNGLGLWIMPLYRGENVWGMKAGNFKTGYNSNLGGMALGADITVENAFRFGLAFNTGMGHAQSTGDFNRTENKFNFWGLAAYTGWTQDNFGLTADVGYTSTYNEMKQKTPASLAFGNLKADVNAHIWSTGLRAEYKIEGSGVDIIPHVGARFSGMTTDSYRVRGGGGTVFRVDEAYQSLWTFPIGATLSKEIAADNGWTIRPLLDVGVIPAAGDVQTKSRVRMPGVNSSAEMKTQVVDYLTFDTTAGLEVKNANVALGLNYNNQASEHRTGHGVLATVRYAF